MIKKKCVGFPSSLLIDLSFNSSIQGILFLDSSSDGLGTFIHINPYFVFYKASLLLQHLIFFYFIKHFKSWLLSVLNVSIHPIVTRPKFFSQPSLFNPFPHCRHESPDPCLLIACLHKQNIRKY